MSLPFLTLFEDEGHGVSNLNATIDKNIRDARMMCPQDPGSFLAKMVKLARAKGQEEVAQNFEAALTALSLTL